MFIQPIHDPTVSAETFNTAEHMPSETDQILYFSQHMINPQSQTQLLIANLHNKTNPSRHLRRQIKERRKRREVELFADNFPLYIYIQFHKHHGVLNIETNLSSANLSMYSLT